MLSPVSVISKVVRIGRVTVDAAGAGLGVLTADPHDGSIQVRGSSVVLLPYLGLEQL
jgi:hypothetical protein